jgi:hypothetical protein
MSKAPMQSVTSILWINSDTPQKELHLDKGQCEEQQATGCPQ